MSQIVYATPRSCHIVICRFWIVTVAIQSSHSVWNTTTYFEQGGPDYKVEINAYDSFAFFNRRWFNKFPARKIPKYVIFKAKNLGRN